MSDFGWVCVMLLAFIGSVAVVDAAQHYGDTGKVKQACFDAGFAGTLRAGDHWYCTRKRAGNDEVVEVHRLREVAP